ncbi:MAG: hypothetical protein WC781_00720 [Candidatus Pacearchaeota archaeon]|jgi:hypothetical protein
MEESNKLAKISKKKIMTFVAIAFVIVICIAYYLSFIESNKNYEDIAKCLTSKNVTMYGSIFCSHCQEEKKTFGDSWKYVNYVECSMVNLPGENEFCISKKIEAYPTWEFPNGSRKVGFISPEELGKITNCP